VAAVVTGPVSKVGLEMNDFSFPGQTEFFAQSLGAEEVAMCLTGDTLTVGLATIHIPLAAVPQALTSARIEEAGALLAEFVASRRGRQAGKIAVAGLNPHAGEAGKFGDEEDRIIAPSIKRLNERFPGVFSGPHVPDAIFRDAAAGQYDAVLAMYHDQGLIPLKLLDFDSAVNVTLGLPKPRTSPDHGTAFDIAGKGLARPGSMIRAIQLAAELARVS
jgi:4-hydroxythreonine-4-phosphate dehydrogenase